MNAALTAKDVKGLAGQCFELPGRSGPIPFHLVDESGWPRCGAEAYATPVVCHHPAHGPIPSVLKIFHRDIPERVERTRHLVGLGLARKHWLFKGFPYALVAGVELGGVRVVGHVCQRAAAPDGTLAVDLRRLRDGGAWTFGAEQLRRIAGQLCCAVKAFEGLDYVHGDLGSGNVAVAARGDDVWTITVDQDGFSHPGAPAVPSSLRTLGTPGYQYPELLDRQGDPSARVETDRFALAALLCETMAWTPADADGAGRDELLSVEVIRARDVGLLPRDVIQRFPKGFELLDAALRARTPKAMPGPADWMAALGIPVHEPAAMAFVGRPVLTVEKVVGHIRRVARLRSESGDLGRFDAALRDVVFTAKGGTLSLELRWHAPILLERQGARRRVGDGPMSIALEPGDVLVANQWRFTVGDDAR